jgi:hypothetical protein
MVNGIHNLIVALALAGGTAAQTQFRELLKTALPPATGAQCIAVGDSDGDGDVDIALGAATGTIALFANSGLGTLTDQSQRLPVLAPLPITALVFADLDRDGQLDLVVAARRRCSLLFARNGRFVDETATRLGTVQDDARDVAAFDADRDGDLDLLLVNLGQHRLFANDGRGRFTDITATALPVTADDGRAVAVADVDRDGDLDLFVGKTGGDRLLLNDGAGRFADASAALVGPSGDTVAVAALDIDRDGDIDLLAGAAGRPILYLQNNRQWFADPIAAEQGVDALAVGDVDRDGWTDVLLIGSAVTGLYLNPHNPPWLTRPNQGLVPAVMESARDAAFVDLDFDADLDLVIASPLGTRIYYNDRGSGNFLEPRDRALPEFASSAVGLAAADFDRDGDLELQVLGSLPVGSPPGNPAPLLRNDGYGLLTESFGVLDGLRAAVFADFDADGWPDLAAADDRGERLYLNDRGRSYIDVSTTHLPAATDITGAVAAGDIDGDGDVDLVFGNFGQSKVYVNDGNRRFFDGTPGRLPIATDTATAVVLADLDRDGDLDLGIANLDRPSRVALNDGQGRFTDLSPAQFPPPGPTARAMAMADFDGDGDLDVLFGTTGQSRLYRHDRGALTDITASALPVHADAVTALVTGDVDGDGDIDVVLGILGQNRLWSNDGRGVFRDLTGTGMPATPGPTRALLLADFDGDGDLDLVEAADRVRLFANLSRHLHAPGFALIGAPYTLDTYVEPWRQTQRTVVPFLALARLARPQPTAFGMLGVDPASVIALPALVTTGGVGRGQWPIPATVALRGLGLHWQALIAPGSATQSARLTGLVSDRVGR